MSIQESKQQYESAFNEKMIAGFTALQVRSGVKFREQDYQPSKLPKKVQKIVKLIFDKDAILTCIKKSGYDNEKLPMGHLEPETIKQGYRIL